MKKKKNRTRPHRLPIEIAYWEVGVNLAKDGRWDKRKMESMLSRHKIADGQCIALFNNSHMFGGSGYHPPKCRLYLKLGGVPVCLIPAVDSKSQVTYQLLLNEWLRSTFGTGLTDIHEVFDEFDAKSAERELRRKAAAALAA